MKKISYPAKFYMLEIILSILTLAFFISVSLILYAENPNRSVWLIFGLFVFFLLIDLVYSVRNIQWINIDNNAIYARNIFGTIKKLELAKIQLVKIVDAHPYKIIHSKKYSCIVVSYKNTLNEGEVEDAYNHKKCDYIILPNSDTNLQLLKKAYIEASDAEFAFE